MISSSLRELPFEIDDSPHVQMFKVDVQQVQWVQQPIIELVDRIEKGFKFDQLKLILKNIPVHRRPPVILKSRKRTANGLAYHLQCRISYLIRLPVSQLFHHLLCRLPTTPISDVDWTVGEIIQLIIQSEYGQETERIVSQTTADQRQAWGGRLCACSRNAKALQRQQCPSG